MSPTTPTPPTTPTTPTTPTNDRVLTALIKAKALIVRGWTKNSMARDAAGLPVASDNPDACQWCMYGAVLSVTRNAAEVRNLTIHAVCAALPEVYAVGGGVTQYNDAGDRTHAQVLRVFDMAIKKTTFDA